MRTPRSEVHDDCGGTNPGGAERTWIESRRSSPGKPVGGSLEKRAGYAEFLDELLSCEVDTRRTRYLRARLQLAHLPFVKTFDQFDFAFQPSIDERQVRELRSLRFVHEASNVVFLGPPDPATF